MPRRIRNLSVASRRSAAWSSAFSSAMSSAVSSAAPSRATSPGPLPKPFRFFDLPSELRLKIYEELLIMAKPLDLDPANSRLLLPRMGVFLASRRMHDEAYRVFYSQPVCLFPYHGRFFNARKPLLQRLPKHYRRVINTVEMRFGQGWTRPPRCQNTKSTLGLRDCISLRVLKIFIEIDPSHDIFTGFLGKNATEDTYKWFCVDLLRGVLAQVPTLETVEIDAYPSVKREAPLVMAICRVIEERGLRLVWGPLRGWDQEGDAPGLIGLEAAMAGMGISDVPSRIVEIQA